MNKLASALALGIVLSGGMPVMASATQVPDPCPVSVSCEAHRILGTVHVSAASTAPAPVNCGLNAGCIKTGLTNGGQHPVQAPAAMSPETPASTSAAISRMAASFTNAFAFHVPAL